MNEKELKNNFMENHFNDFKGLIGIPEIRVYAIELPLRARTKNYFADLVLINESLKQFYVMEWKKDKIDYGPVDQLKLYVELTDNQFYRSNTIGILVAPDFSDYEIKECKSNNFLVLKYNGTTMSFK